MLWPMETRVRRGCQCFAGCRRSVEPATAARDPFLVGLRQGSSNAQRSVLSSAPLRAGIQHGTVAGHEPRPYLACATPEALITVVSVEALGDVLDRIAEWCQAVGECFRSIDAHVAEHIPLALCFLQSVKGSFSAALGAEMR